ncbi:hypothetical protein AAWM_04648 [Aspergillus awamori]|uniref:DUF7770 domain-containing protein n=2 Tax=Aspergillaceae TaxID=1131492 RepID=A0A507QK23_MONPU|nr:hypothetical protein CBS11852_10736 [Aspergillus niger]TQB68879.1 hypothetical protein MPDQ_002652 [Monascus purpureus]GCB21763.1 hypothetical protein AAWM_04648 [Aspergillus awamori]KAI2924481.1 hypothetical protein CBS147371_943 [Aspergillus niger]KAI3028787.1 hypothetical protein CBS147347_3628 [Aspergillus niger]
MANFEPVNFIPRHRQAEILELPVQSLIAAPHSKHAGTNHWCLYALTSDATSVRFDCQPSYSVPNTILPGGSKAYVIISELQYAVSRDAQAQFILRVTPGLKVRHVYDLLIQNGRHKYEFDSNGVGCRFWTTDQINLLHQHRLITDTAQVTAAKNGILKLWPDQTPLELDRGAYY